MIYFDCFPSPQLLTDTAHYLPPNPTSWFFISLYLQRTLRDFISTYRLFTYAVQTELCHREYERTPCPTLNKGAINNWKTEN